MAHRLEILEPPYTEEVTSLLADYPSVDGYTLKLFRVFANSTRFLKKGVLNLLDRGSPLSLRQRELVILRVCANKDCEYEWGVHVAGFAVRAGINEMQVRATRLGAADDECWSPDEQVLLRAVDELCKHARMETSSLACFQAHFTPEQQLEIFALCGNYHTVSFVAHAAGLEQEPFGVRFPDA